MPSDVVKSFADKTGKSIKTVEDLWDKAIEIVKKEYDIPENDDRFYKLVTGILKKMLKIEGDLEEEPSITTTSSSLGTTGSFSKYAGLNKRNKFKKKKNESFGDSFRKFLDV